MKKLPEINVSFKELYQETQWADPLEAVFAVYPRPELNIPKLEVVYGS